ncbi:hypothetical protein ACFPRL_10345 [Pseudoclavibacter helvolus]
MVAIRWECCHSEWQPGSALEARRWAPNSPKENSNSAEVIGANRPTGSPQASRG